MSVNPGGEHDWSLDEDRHLDPETIAYHRQMEHLERQAARAQAQRWADRAIQVADPLIADPRTWPGGEWSRTPATEAEADEAEADLTW